MIVYDDLEPSEKIKVYDKGITVNGNGNGTNGDKKYQMLVGYRTGDMWAPQLDMTEALGVELREFVGCVEQARDADRRRACRPARRPDSRSRDRVARTARARDRTRTRRVHRMIPFLDLKAQYQSIKPEIDSAVIERSGEHAVRARRRGRGVRARVRRLLRRQARDRREFRHERAAPRAARRRRRPRRRSHHRSRSRSSRPCRRSATPARSRCSSTSSRVSFTMDPAQLETGDHAADQGDPAGAPLRPDGRHGRRSWRSPAATASR